MRDDYILVMENITKEFSSVKALNNVNLKVKKGEIHALCGENGAGKSTLMNVLSGVYPYGTYEGEIFYKNKKCKFRNIKESEHEGIVIIQQELALIPYLSIAENIFLGNEQVSLKGVIDWNKTNDKAIEMLKVVGLENENVTEPINSIGVGKQQLVEISKALAKKVELLILDEPTASLNDKESMNLLEIIKSLKNEGITCIIISHKLNEISYIADSITIIRDGQTIQTLHKGKDSFDEDIIIKGMVGRELTNRYPKRENCKIGDIILEVDNWNVFNVNCHVLRDISFNVRAGEVLGIAGLMGSGRTELAMSIFGKTYGDNISGTIKVHGKEVVIKSVKDAIKNKIAYTSEDRKTYGLVLIDDIKHNMTMSSLKILFSKFGVINDNEEILKSQEYKKLLNLKSSSINQTVSSLSGGNQQKVVLAKWMLSNPDILILDEPTRGIDVGAKYEIYSIINDLVKMGKAVIIISSELPEIIGMSDRVYVLNDGKIVGELQKEEIDQVNIMKCIIQDNTKN